MNSDFASFVHIAPLNCSCFILLFLYIRKKYDNESNWN